MVILMKKSNNSLDGRRPKIYFSCERSRVYRSKVKSKDPNHKKENEKNKRIETRKYNCPFS